MINSINKTGFISGLTAFVAATAFGIVQSLQLTGILIFPWDDILIYAISLCIVIPLLLEMLALHFTTPDDKKFWSHAALVFSIIYSFFVTVNYVVQLATVLILFLI